MPDYPTFAFEAVQDAVFAALQAEPLLAGIPGIERKEKELQNDINAALQQLKGICYSVPPPLPLRATRGAKIVWFPEAEISVMLAEQPKLNKFPLNIWRLQQIVAVALHNKFFPGVLASNCPLLIAETPFVVMRDETKRVVIVKFTGQFGFPPNA